MKELEGNCMIIKERPPMRYSLSVGLIAFLPVLLLNILMHPLFSSLSAVSLAVMFAVSFSFTLVLNRGFSLEISEQGICQRYFGQTLYFIKWSDIGSITYSDAFPGPRYRIRARSSWLTSIELPIEDENFPAIKKALADRGLVLAKAQLNER
jgi:hypothetical protein